MIKPKTHINCKNKSCKKLFKRYSTLDKYCCPKCKIEATEGVIYKAKNRSTKRAKEESEYLQLNKIFLKKPENKYCPVAKHLKLGNVLTSEVHHKKGRIGKLLLYVPYWLAVSSEGHKWIHANPEESYKLGFLIKSTLPNPF